MRDEDSASSRRRFMAQTLAGLGAALPPLVSPRRADPVRLEGAAGSLKVVCVGGHPDDPESGCGGTLAAYAAQRHAVTIIYLTRGERGIPGKPEAEAATIRTAEAETACKILGAKPLFAGQIDGATEVTRSRVDALSALLAAEAPDLVLTHWPIDTHMDHQAASLLTMRAYVAAGRRFPIHFFEVNTGSQTIGFAPTHYVDITAEREKKKSALFAHKSQNGEQIYKTHHEVMESFRGREARVQAAEAFIVLPAVPARGVPGVARRVPARIDARSGRDPLAV